MAGLFNLPVVDGGVLATLPTVDVAGLGAVGVSDLVGLDLSVHKSALICRAFDLEAFSFFAKRCGLGLETFVGAADLDVVVLLSCALGDGCVSSAAWVGVSTSELQVSPGCGPSLELRVRSGCVAWTVLPSGTGTDRYVERARPSLRWTGRWLL